ncbi:hypothetical protein EYV94_16135 [Puteibacter caeruleilacunae]|nr:hypothetical protein EYV94_16135 [Puteibacter caeruleilacunae]
MGSRRLYNKFGHQDFSHPDFDPIEAFESRNKPVDDSLVPEERVTKPTHDFKQNIEQVSLEYPRLAKELSKLNPYQLQAVFSDDRKVLLSAMVGSGKTTVLTHKILYLHFVKKVPLTEMAVLTFTNKAAREIKERILSFYDGTHIPNNNEMRYFGTFHAIARQLNKEHPLLDKLGFTEAFSILDEEAKDEFFQRLIISHNLDIKYKNKLDQRLKSYKSTKQVLYGNMKHDDDFPQLIKLAQKEKQSNNVMDFDDLINVVNWLLKRERSFLPKWVIIDEFQDCNEEQLQMVSHLSNSSTNFFAVGDPNQSIYTWRGSTNKIFQTIIADPESVVMQLPLNYRTSSQLLDAAAYLLQDQHRNLKATRPEGNKLNIRNHYDDSQEAYYYVQRFKELHEKGAPWEEIAVLFRTRQQIAIFEAIFQLENIPCQVVTKTTLREQPVLYWLQKLLLAALHPNDMDSILNVFTSTHFGCLKAGKRLINAFNKFTDDKAFESKLVAFGAFLEAKYPKHHLHCSLAQKMDQFQSYLNDSGRDKDIYHYFDLDMFLKPTSVHYQLYKEDINQALEDIQQFTCKNYYGNWTEIYQAAMSQVNLEGHFHINNGIEINNQGIPLLTIHAAKGLEFDYVFLSGANTGIIPLKRAKEGPGHLKEEKRLLFVALTRARNYMEISWHTKSSAWNADDDPSYFLNAIPDVLIESHSQAKNDKEDNKPQEPQSQTTGKWQPGMKVKHPKYGEGQVVSCSNDEVLCSFGKFGEKGFAPQWAPLVAI